MQCMLKSTVRNSEVLLGVEVSVTNCHLQRPRVPTNYNFALDSHTFGGLSPPDPPPLFSTLLESLQYCKILSDRMSNLRCWVA